MLWKNIFAFPLKSQIEVQNFEETDGLGWFSLSEILDENFDTFENVRMVCQKIVDNHRC